MKVFISWSGITSREIANALHDWLPYVLQFTRPFVSTGDIAKGRRWNEVITAELDEAAFGIVCITRDNYRAPWINFEAGAISKALHLDCVSPLLFNIEPSRISGPLQQFQLTTCSEDDIFELVRSINSAVDSKQQLPIGMLRQEFDAWWPELKGKLDSLAKDAPEATETGFEWLYTLEDLARIQDSGTWRDIWIVSPNLYRNTFKPPIREVIQKKLAAKVTYNFIIPATNGQSDVGKEALAQIVTNAAVKEIPEDDFNSLAVTDYVILYPAADTAAPQVFLELPISPDGYWIRVDEEGALGFIRRFRKLGQFSQP
jgi:TIR domain-containing protein